jgi:hypothetical protein
LLTNPAIGGSPIMPSAPSEKQVEVHGMRKASPFSPSIRFTPARSSKMPAQKNSVIFISP